MIENQIVVWRGQYFNTTELFRLEKSDLGYKCTSQIIGEIKGTPVQVSYNLAVDRRWRVQSVLIETRTDTFFSFHIYKDNLGRWWDAQGKQLSEFDSCKDIDISLTPFTNTLPINRLSLQFGDAKELEVIYFDLLRNEMKTVQQRYSYRKPCVYKYDNLVTGFTTVIETDENGFVTDYPGIWKRIYPINHKDKPG